MPENTKNDNKSDKFNKIANSDFERIDGYLLNAIEDTLDFRDFRYQPALLQLQTEIPPPTQIAILDQGREGACTGFGLAAVINLLLTNRNSSRKISSRMLYEMAKKFDEWEGEDYSGSSCRGAVKGWNSMGVCSDKLAPYKVDDTNWSLTIERAKDARKTTLGAYYRLSKRLSDYHAALNEVGVLYVSARVHEGWQQVNVAGGEIPLRSTTIGGHAFAIIGYNQEGFWVQNSWGKDWGKNGVALWSYEDWLENVQDAWVARLALSTPQIWHLTPTVNESKEIDEGLFKRSPKRSEIAGHFVHIDDGDFDDKGKYWTNIHTVRGTASLVSLSEKYDHLLFYAHGGLNSIESSARRVVAMKEVFKDNRIYPFHFMYDTGLLEEIRDVILGKKEDVERKVGGFTDFSDKLIEKSTRHVGRAIWREMKNGARKPFDPGRAGTETIQAFLNAFASSSAVPKKIHIVGHSTGAILLASLLEALDLNKAAPRIETCMLMAPACSHNVFIDVYRRLLKERDRTKFGINRMKIYNLNDHLERDDTVTPLYRKSLLYLVSNAFEEKRGEYLLGMQVFRRFLRNLPGPQIFRIEISNGSTAGSPRTSSQTHGGFDNDVNTMNDIVHCILRGKPSREFKPEDLEY